MPNDNNQNLSGTQDALREDAMGTGMADKAKEMVTDKLKEKGKSALKDKFGKKGLGKSNPSDNDTTGGNGGAVNSIGSSGDKSGNKGGLFSNKSDKSDIQKLRDIKNKAQMAGHMATTGAKVGMMAKMMGAVQMIASMMTNLVSGAVGGMAAFVSAIGNAIAAGATFVLNLGIGLINGAATGISVMAGMLASTLGISSTAATIAASSLLLGGGSGAIAVAAALGASMFTNRADDGPIDCRQVVASAVNEAQINPNAMMLNNAKHVYSAMKAFGLSDEQIAGMLGNMQTESSIDPTVIEGIYTEPFNINGPRHQKAISDLDAYTRGELSAMYAKTGTDYTQNSGYLASDGKKYPGIGMVQYTGGGAMDLIQFAQAVNKNWWDLDFQLAYSMAKGEPTKAFDGDFWNKYREQTGSVAQMTQFFSQYFEGNTIMAQSQRQVNAEAWFAQMQDWEEDTAYGQSVVAMAQKLGAMASDQKAFNALQSCVGANKYDNSTLAAAAVSYSYATQAEGIGNNGTPLYQAVEEGVREGAISLFQSCDRGVASAVRWSGTDVEMLMGDTTAQFAYLSSSPKWQKVGNSSTLTMADLQPGDIFCLVGHIFLYTGHKAIAAKYPDAPLNYDSISASLNERSPGCGVDANDIINRMHGQDWIGRGEYVVFRCIKPDNSDKFKHIGAGVE